MKKYIITMILAVFFITLSNDAYSQRRGTKKRTTTTQGTDDSVKVRSSRDRSTEQVSIMEKLNPEIKLGNLQFFGNVFQASLKSNIGYKLNKTFTAGVGAKFDYLYINQVGSTNDFGSFSYGAFTYARAKLGSNFYLQGEYNAFSTELSATTLIPRTTFFYPAAGIGYMYDGFDWSSGIEVMVPFNGDIRDTFGIVEYLINFSKNF